MTNIIVVDTRQNFLAEVTGACRAVDARIIPIADPSCLKDIRQSLLDAVIALWADCPPVHGVDIARTLLRAWFARSRIDVEGP